MNKERNNACKTYLLANKKNPRKLSRRSLKARQHLEPGPEHDNLFVLQKFEPLDVGDACELSRHESDGGRGELQLAHGLVDARRVESVARTEF